MDLFNLFSFSPDDLKNLILLLSMAAIGAVTLKKVRLPTHRTMTLKQWLAIPDAPVQRNTEKRVREFKVRRRLGTLISAHTNVVMAQLPDGSCYKADAHTRTYMWVNGMTDQVPEKLDVTVYQVDDIDGVLDLYYSLDDSDQAKTASDQLYSAFKQFDIPITSKFFQLSSGIISALKEAYREVCRAYSIETNADESRRVSVAKIVEFFKPQLAALDAIAPKACRNNGPNFKGPVTTAFLLAHYKYSELGKNVADVVSFFTAYNNDLGQKHGKKYDPVYSVTKTMSGPGGAEQIRLQRTAEILGAVERWLEPRGREARYSRQAEVDLSNYLGDHNARKTSRAQRARFAKNPQRKTAQRKFTR